jgi:uncharacterized protein (TIGR03437 family)
MGATHPQSADGVVAPANQPPQVALPVSVTIGGQPAQVTYQGAAPGLVAGVTQINAVVPTSIEPGVAVPVTVTVGNTAAQNTVTVSVK